MMMPQRSEHRLRYLERGGGKVRGKGRDGEGGIARRYAGESSQPVRKDPSFCLTFMKRQQAGRARQPLFFSAIQ